ncbi:MAG: DUF86 domain-containing protein [Cyanobacteria bacterium P01_A01_bin.116]
MNNRDAGYLWDMVQAITRVQEFTKDLSYDDYLESHLVQSAVERKLEILGEASGRISTDLRQANPNIDWKRMVGLRNILIHRYNDVETETIWFIVTSVLGPTKIQLEYLLPPISEV